MNVADLVVLAGLATLVVGALWLMRRSRMQGNCASCPYAKGCTKHC